MSLDVGVIGAGMIGQDHIRRLARVLSGARVAAVRAMKAIVTGGEIGAPLVMLASHRNASVPDHYTAGLVTNDTVGHDVRIRSDAGAQEPV